MVIPASGEKVDVKQTFTYFGSVIHSSTSCELEVNRRTGRPWSAMNALDESVRCTELYSMEGASADRDVASHFVHLRYVEANRCGPMIIKWWT